MTHTTTASTGGPASSSSSSSSVCPYYYHTAGAPSASRQADRGVGDQHQEQRNHHNTSLDMDAAGSPVPTGGCPPMLTIAKKSLLLSSPPAAASTAAATAATTATVRPPIPSTPRRRSRVVLAPAPLDLPAHMPTASITVLSVRLSASQTTCRRSCLLSAAPRHQQQQQQQQGNTTTTTAYLLLNQLTKPKDRVRLWLAQVLQAEEGEDGREEGVYTLASPEKVVIKESDARFIRQYGRLWGEDPVAEVAALTRVQQQQQHQQQQQGHPNIVSMQAAFEGVGSSQGMLFMVLPYLAGDELFYQVTEAEGQQGLGEEATRPILRQVLAGLLHLKQKHGIRHGDVSPENVMVAPDGQVTLIDLGMAERVPSFPSSLPPSSSTILLEARPRRGKKQYMSPEIYEEREYDPFAADVWALGALLYVCWTGCTIYRSAFDQHFMSLKEGGREGGLWRLLAEREGKGSTRVLSSEAKELLGMMMAWGFEERMTLEEVAAHPWLVGREGGREGEVKEEEEEVVCVGMEETQFLLSNSSSVSGLSAFGGEEEEEEEVSESSSKEGEEEGTEDGVLVSLRASSPALPSEAEAEEAEEEEENNYSSRASSSTSLSSTPSKQSSNNCDHEDTDNSLASLQSLHRLESLQNTYNNNSNNSNDDFDNINNDEDQGCRLPSSTAPSSSSLCFPSSPSCCFVADEEGREGEEEEEGAEEGWEDMRTVSVSFSSSSMSLSSLAPPLLEEAQEMLLAGF